MHIFIFLSQKNMEHQQNKLEPEKDILNAELLNDMYSKSKPFEQSMPHDVVTVIIFCVAVFFMLGIALLAVAARATIDPDQAYYENILNHFSFFKQWEFLQFLFYFFIFLFIFIILLIREMSWKLYWMMAGYVGVGVVGAAFGLVVFFILLIFKPALAIFAIMFFTIFLSGFLASVCFYLELYTFLGVFCFLDFCVLIIFIVRRHKVYPTIHLCSIFVKILLRFRKLLILPVISILIVYLLWFVPSFYFSLYSIYFFVSLPPSLSSLLYFPSL